MCMGVGVRHSVLPKIFKEERTMAYRITEECVKCGACAAECPVEAITEGDETYVIDPDTCISCGNCQAVCPVGAPVEE